MPCRGTGLFFRREWRGIVAGFAESQRDSRGRDGVAAGRDALRGGRARARWHVGWSTRQTRACGGGEPGRPGPPTPPALESLGPSPRVRVTLESQERPVIPEDRGVLLPDASLAYTRA